MPNPYDQSPEETGMASSWGDFGRIMEAARKKYIQPWASKLMTEEATTPVTRMTPEMVLGPGRIGSAVGLEPTSYEPPLTALARNVQDITMPGPRLGTLIAKGEGAGRISEILQRRMPKRLMAKLQQSPKRVEAELSDEMLPREWQGGIFNAKPQYATETAHIQVRPDLYAPQLEQTLLHEGVHGAAAAAGKFDVPPPGARFTQEWYDRFGWGYPEQFQRERELLPNLVATPELVDVVDRNKVLRFLEESYGRSPKEIQRQRHAMKATMKGGLPAPSTLPKPPQLTPEQALEELWNRARETPGGISRIPEDLREVLGSASRSQRDWKAFFEGLPESVTQRYQEILKSASHSTDPVTKDKIRKSADAYIANYRKLTAQGKGESTENEALKKKLLRGDFD